MNYSPAFFYRSLPKWKWKKDPILTKVFYRPVSFVTASICANLNIQANTVSYISSLIAIIACLLFLVDNVQSRIMGAALVSVWLIMDCTDGNLARAINKQPFGIFADSMSSYILVGLLGGCMGVAVYRTGGFFITPGNIWIVFLGAMASSSDSLMRLIYQKYKATARELIILGVMPEEKDVRTDNTQVDSLSVRLENELGIGGILPAMILFGTVYNALDLVVIYCFIYYGGSFVVMTLMHVKKAINHTCEIERRN